jgi:hypothetical protein
MILKSFLTGFTAYVLTVIYNLLQGSSLKIVFINGIKFLFTITFLALVFQMIFFHFSSDSSSDSEAIGAENGDKNQKRNKDKESEAAKDNKGENNFNPDKFSEDFSPLNPPEIEEHNEQ